MNTFTESTNFTAYSHVDTDAHRIDYWVGVASSLMPGSSEPIPHAQPTLDTDYFRETIERILGGGDAPETIQLSQLPIAYTTALRPWFLGGAGTGSRERTTRSEAGSNPFHVGGEPDKRGLMIVDFVHAALLPTIIHKVSAKETRDREIDPSGRPSDKKRELIIIEGIGRLKLPKVTLSLLADGNDTTFPGELYGGFVIKYDSRDNTPPTMHTHHAQLQN